MNEVTCDILNYVKGFLCYYYIQFTEEKKNKNLLYFFYVMDNNI